MKKNTINISCILVLLAVSLFICGCTSTSTTNSTADTGLNVQASNASSASENSLLVYCGAGMKEPMDEIAKIFEQNTGIKIKYTYGGSEQLLSQIELYQKGDVYMPGALGDIQSAREKGFVNRTQDIVYHVITIVVPKGNPKNITSLEDMAKPGVRVALGEPTGPAIGNSTKKMLTKDGLWDSINANSVVKTGTVNELLTYVSMNQADAAIVYEDLYNPASMEKIDIPKNQGKVDIVPIGTLVFSKNKADAERFVNFVGSDEGKAIFEKNGFVKYPSAKYGDA